MSKRTKSLSIKERILKFPTSILDYHQEGNLVEYLHHVMKDGEFPVLAPEEWDMFMQLCHNNVPSAEKELKQYLSRLDTHHLLGITLGKNIKYDVEGINLLLEMLRQPHYRKGTELIYDHVQTFPLTALSRYPELVNTLTIVPQDTTVKIGLNTRRVFLHTFPEENKTPTDTLLLLDTRKVHTVESDEFNRVSKYLYYKATALDKVRYFVLRESMLMLGKLAEDEPSRYALTNKLNQDIIDTVRWLLDNGKIDLTTRSEDAMLNGGWSLYVGADAGHSKAQRYYVQGNLF